MPSRLITETGADIDKLEKANAPLVGANIALFSEVKEGQRYNSSSIKELTGDDSVVAKELYNDTFSFTPHCTPFILCNDKPSFSFLDSALLSRLELFKLEKSVIPFIGSLPVEKRKKKLRDILADEGEEMINLAIEYADMAAQRNWRPTRPRALQNLLDEYEEEQDPLKDWVAEHIEHHTELTLNDEICQSWREYARGKEIPDKEAHGISKKISRYLVKKKFERGRLGGCGKRGFKLRVKNLETPFDTK